MSREILDGLLPWEVVLLGNALVAGFLALF